MNPGGRSRGLNNTHLKQSNRGMVLRLVAAQPRSRADITGHTDLSKMSITNIVGGLIEEGYLVETSREANTSVGRNPVLLDIAPTAPVAVGVYLSRDALSVLVSDLRLNILFSDRKPLRDETADTLTQKLFSAGDAAFAYLLENQLLARCLGIGVSAIGPLDPGQGTLLHPTHFFGIREYPIASLLEERYRLPVLMENDMNTSAMAELLYGKGAGEGSLDSFLYLGVTNGIGAGIVVDRRLYQSGSLSVGEIGHTCISFDGPVCSCGNRGCLEVYANMPVILEKLRRVTGREVTTADFTALSEDPNCDAVFQEVLEKLSVALVNAVNLLAPQAILLGHEGVFFPPRYLKWLEKRIGERILSSGYRSPPVLYSSFGGKAPLLGSVCLLFDRLFAGDFPGE